MSNQTQDFCSCGPACTCAPCVCRQAAGPAPNQAACCENGQPDGGKSGGCACEC